MRFRIFHIIFAVVFFSLIGQGQSLKEWRADLRFLAAELVKRHPDPFHAVGKDEFEKAVKTLDARLSKLSGHQVILEMTKIVAMINEGHTRVNLPREGQWKFGRYPVRFYLYRNGLFVQEIASEHKEFVGSRVVKIGDTPAEEVLKMVTPFVHRDNEMTRDLLLPLFIGTPEVLQSLQIVKDIGDFSLTIADGDGRQQTIRMKPVSGPETVQWVKANRSATRELPLWQKKLDENYWFEYLENLKTVYVQFNSVNDKKGESIAQFSERIYNFIKDNQVEKLVLDIRLNDGGNSRLALPLLNAIIRSDKINQRGKFFTIIGRATFSAAIVFAVELEKYTQTIFVGEPTGGSPNQYGEMLSFDLPNSKLRINYAAYYFQTAGPFDYRPSLTPTIAAEPTIESFSQNVDPAMEAAINFTTPKSLSSQMREAYAGGGISSAITAYQKYKNSPENRYIDTEREVRVVANQLLEQKKLDDAISIFKLNVADYPERAAPLISLAEAYSERFGKIRAKEFYQKGLSLLDSDRSINKAFAERLKGIANAGLTK